MTKKINEGVKPLIVCSADFRTLPSTSEFKQKKERGGICQKLFFKHCETRQNDKNNFSGSLPTNSKKTSTYQALSKGFQLPLPTLTQLLHNSYQRLPSTRQQNMHKTAEQPERRDFSHPTHNRETNKPLVHRNGQKVLSGLSALIRRPGGGFHAHHLAQRLKRGLKGGLTWRLLHQQQLVGLATQGETEDLRRPNRKQTKSWKRDGPKASICRALAPCT